MKVEGDWWFAHPHTETDDQGRYSVRVDDPKGWKKQFNNVRVQAFAQTRGIIQIFARMLAAKPYSAVSERIDGVTAGQGRTIDLRIGGPNDNVHRTPWGSTEATAAAFVVHREMQEHYRDLRGRAFTADDFDERGGDRVGGVEVIVPAVGVTSYYNTTTGFVNLIPGGANLPGAWPGISGGGDWPAIEDIGDHPFLDPPVSFFLATVRHEYSHAIHDEMTGGGILTGLTLPSRHGPDRKSPYPALAYTEGFAEFLPLVSLGQGGAYEPTLEAEGGLPIPVASPPGTHHEWEGEFVAFLWDLFDPVGTETVRHRTTRTENGGVLLPEEIMDAQVWTDGIEDPRVSRIRRAVREPMPGGHIPQRVREYLANYARLYGSQDLYEIKTIAFNRDLTIPGVDERPARLEGMEMEHLGLLSYRFQVVEPDAEDRTSVQVTVWYEPSSGALQEILDLDLGSGWSGSRREVTAMFDVPGRGAGGDRLWALINDGMLPTAYRFDVPEVDEERLADLLEDIRPDPIGERFEPGVVPRERPVVETGDLRRPHDPSAGADGAFRLLNFRSGPVCRDPDLVDERREKGRPPSDRICEEKNILIRGQDGCVFDGEWKRCTWWGYEFDYENADPDQPLVCAWTRSRPTDVGNSEGIRESGVMTGTDEIELPQESGHFFGPGYDVHLPVPWMTIDVRYACTYRGEPAFEFEHRVVFSSAFR